MEDVGVGFQRYLLAALAGLVAIVFWSGLSDPTSLPKTTLTAVVAVLLLGSTLLRVIVTRRIVLLQAPVVWAALALALGLVVATLASDVPAASWAGALGRSDGLLLYGSCLVCFLTAVSVLGPSTLRPLVVGLLVGGLAQACYGLLQKVGVDPIKWADLYHNQIIGTLGNPDFEAAYVGIILPLAAWGVLTRTWELRWRVASGVVGLACLSVAVVSSSVQGLMAGAAGLVVVAIGLLLARDDRAGRIGLGVVAAGSALGALMVTVGLLAGIGPAERLIGASSLTSRKWYWRSALHLWRENPLDGVGLDRFGAYYRSVRPAAAADARSYTDAAHSVPLHLLATGGLLVALPYLVVTVLVLVALGRGLWQLRGEERLLLAGVGGAWVAYQVQSLVSIDEPALAVTNWLLAGAVVALAAPPQRRDRLLPGALVRRPPKGRGAARSTVAAPTVQPNWSGGSVAGVAVVAVAALVVLWQVLIPLRADRAARAAAEQVAAGQGNAAFDSFTAATERAPHVAAYWLARGKFLEQVQQVPRAVQSYDAGLRNDPRSYDLLVAAAHLAKARGDAAAVSRYTRRLHATDPSDGWREAVGS